MPSDEEEGLWPFVKRVLGIRLAPPNASPTLRNAARTSLILAAGALAGLAAVYLHGESTPASITGALVAASAAAVGFFLGFLFGIPRSRAPAREASPGPSAAPVGAGARPPLPALAVAENTPRLTVNANLEEISDWITKIIVGLGLVELRNVPGAMRSLAEYIARGLVANAGAPPVVFAMGVLVYFSVLGFLSGYLLTRLFLAGAFSAADEGLDAALQQIERQRQRIVDQEHTIQGANESSTALAGTLRAMPSLAEDGQSADDRMKGLKERYAQARTEPPGSGKTSEMTEIVTKMISLAPAVGRFDVRAALGSDVRETRLVGYAFVFASPSATFFEPLVDSLARYSAHDAADQGNCPFGEYWGLLALGQAVDELKKSNLQASAEALRKLNEWGAALKAGTDRSFELNRILKKLSGAATA